MNINEHYNQIFDSGPLMTMQTLLPFAQKARKSCQYRLILNDGFDINNIPEFLIKPISHRKSNMDLITDDTTKTYQSNFA